MEFRLLGPLEAVRGDTPVGLGSRKPRALLARLLLDANRTVSVERLVDDLWGEDVPGSAPKMVQIYVSQLRKSLPADVLRTQAPGYLVAVEPEALDLARFGRLRVEGRAALEAGDADAAATRLADALDLWRGPALAEFSEPFARVERAHLEELRLACLEDRIDADLAAGREADVVAEVEALAAQHPLRERLHRQLILALYRAGRQAEALAAYDRFRRTLDDELGIEPSPALKRLQQQILIQDPGLEPSAREAPPAPRPRAPAAPSPGFVGRMDELAQLETLLDAAGRGDGSTVLVTGRAGIGKSRLIAELAQRAGDRGATVLTGRCIQLVGVGLPYLPFTEALRSVASSPALAGVAGELHELPRLVPELGGDGGTSVRDGAGRTDSRLRLFQEVFLTLERLGEASPVVVALEDLHWADASTLDLLAFLAHGAARARVLLVGTFRTEEVAPGEPLQRLASGIVGARAAVSLELDPLDREAVAALVRANCAAPPSDALVDAIVARSEGNPLFAKQLLAATSRGDFTLPPALRDMLLADIARLDATARSVLRLAAAAGRDAPYDLLAAVTPLEELELAEALRQAVEQDLLVPDQAAGTFRFRHALFAEAVYETLLPGEREVLHERIARALTEEPQLAVGGAAAGEAAQHWAAARRPVEALAASLEAAREAERICGLTEALGYLERVLALWDEVPDAEELAGVALPAVLSRAAELASLSAENEDEMDLRRVVGVLGFDDWVGVDTVADRLGISAATAERWLAALEHSGLVEHRDDGFRAAPLAMSEARRLYPAAVVLESVAVRRSPGFEEQKLRQLRAANDGLRAAAAAGDAAAASAADDEFHRLLTADCGNDELIAALLPIKRALMRYELVYMSDPARVERSAAQHDEIVAALERRDHAEAARLLRGNLAQGLPDLTRAVEGGEAPVR